MRSVSRGAGYFDKRSWSAGEASWGASATSLPLVAGTMLLRELARGRIDHALAISIPQPRARAFAWPAQRTDGLSLDPHALPEGAHLRLDPNLDLDRLDLPPARSHDGGGGAALRARGARQERREDWVLRRGLEADGPQPLVDPRGEAASGRIPRWEVALRVVREIPLASAPSRRSTTVFRTPVGAMPVGPLNHPAFGVDPEEGHGQPLK
jgi:hypothetical protein